MSPGQDQPMQPQRRVCVACPRCGQGYRIPKRLLGRRLSCRHCREEWRAKEISTTEFRSGKLTGDGSDSGTVVLPSDLSRAGTPSSTGIDTSWAGRRLGRYDIISVLGHGGMAAVWRAHDESLSRDVAVKVLHSRRSRHGSSGHLDADLFKQEARAIAKLQHPSVVSIFEVGEETGQVFLALELMEGGTLKEHVERYGRIPPRELCARMAGPARALALAHRRGIIHRDIKPSNLMFDDHGHLKLMDFGLADVAHEATSRRMRGKTVGSMGWIAPETAKGQPARAASDIYSFGLALAYGLMGKPWLQAPSRGELMELHRNPPKLNLSGIKGLTASAARIVETCLATEPSDRYLSADRVADALQACAEEDPVALSRTRKSKASVAVVAAVFGGLLVGAAVLQYFIELVNRESELRQPVVARRSTAVVEPVGPAAAESPVGAAAVAETGLDVAPAPLAVADVGRLGQGRFLGEGLGEDGRRPWPEVLDGLMLRIVGTRKGRVFHLATSECGRSIYASNLVSFGSVAEALEADRTPCSRCRPAEREVGVAVGPDDNG